MNADYLALKTDSGFTLGLAQLRAAECAAVSVHVPAGSRHDPPDMSGLAHFVEHMVFKGTRTRNARQISVDTEDVGASLNASTSGDQTVYEASGDAATLPLLAEVIRELVWEPTFPEKEIPLECDVIAEEIVLYQESPTDHIDDLISRALWSPHPLGEPVSGSLESIQRVDQSALRRFRDLHHNRNDLVIAVAGPFEPAQVLELFASLPTPRLPPANTPPFAPATSPGTLVESRDTQQVQLALAYPSFGRRDPRRHAFRLLAMILGEGSSSRLFQTLREDRGLCYHVSSDVTLYDDTGALEIHAGLDPASRDEALDCIAAEIQDLTDHGPNDAELARAKRLAASQLRAAMECTASHASWVGECLLQHRQVISPGEALREIERVTPADIRTLAATLLIPTSQAQAEIRPS